MLCWTAPRAGTPPALRAAAAITQELLRAAGTWRITRRTVAPAGPH
jgi:hypothetical protein